MIEKLTKWYDSEIANELERLADGKDRANTDSLTTFYNMADAVGRIAWYEPQRGDAPGFSVKDFEPLFMVIDKYFVYYDSIDGFGDLGVYHRTVELNISLRELMIPFAKPRVNTPNVSKEEEPSSQMDSLKHLFANRHQAAIVNNILTHNGYIINGKWVGVEKSEGEIHALACVLSELGFIENNYGRAKLSHHFYDAFEISPAPSVSTLAHEGNSRLMKTFSNLLS